MAVGGEEEFGKRGQQMEGKDAAWKIVCIIASLK